jgi:hypothetical protein
MMAKSGYTPYETLRRDITPMAPAREPAALRLDLSAVPTIDCGETGDQPAADDREGSR